MLVNTARGDLLDEAAVARARPTAGWPAAALDVLAGGREPLLGAPNTVFTPHLGAQTIEAIDRVGRVTTSDVLAVLAGRPPAAVGTPAGEEAADERADERDDAVHRGEHRRLLGVRLFPLWAEALGLDGAMLVSRDLPLDTGRARYRAAVGAIRDDRAVQGALVTTHKVDLYEAAGDLFDELDPFAQACRGVSCIAKRDGRLAGSAKDPVTAGRALGELLGPGYFAIPAGTCSASAAAAPAPPSWPTC